MPSIGLTGGIGAGKSAVSARLAELGAVIVDADVIAREVVAPGTPGLTAVLAAFGPGVGTEDDGLDRPALGALVFADPEALARLNAIVHPLVARRREELVAAAGPAAVIVHDVPLLVENDLTGGHDLVVVVQAPVETRLRRLELSRGMTEAQARARMAAQATDAQRAAVADVVLDNAGSLDDLHAQVDALWQERISGGRA